MILLLPLALPCYVGVVAWLVAASFAPRPTANDNHRLAPGKPPRYGALREGV